MLFALARADKHVAKEASPFVFLVRLNMKTPAKLLHGIEHRFGPLIFDIAGFHGNDNVGGLFVEAAIEVALIVLGERHLNLITIEIRLIHSNARERVDVHLRDFAELFFDFVGFID